MKLVFKSITFLAILLLSFPAAVLTQDEDPAERLDRLIEQYESLSDLPFVDSNPASMTPAQSWDIDGAPAAAGLTVRVMPGTFVDSQGNRHPYCWINRNLIIWGSAVGAALPVTYTWDFGDGTPVATGVVSTASAAQYIYVTHQYATLGKKTATLTVQDADGDIAMRSVDIDVSPQNQQVEVDAAIEDGLRWLYTTQYSTGYWNDGNTTYDLGGTAAAVLAFQLRGHLASNDFDQDIYAERVHRGLNYMMGLAHYYNIGSQPYGNPDANGNGRGIYIYDGNTYMNGLVIMALAASGNPDRICESGDAAGMTSRDILQDMCDLCGYSQSESSYSRGGWRYSMRRSTGDSDNSAVQWPALGMKAAEENGWGIVIPEFVKSELAVWLAYSQGSNGGFGYTYVNNWPNIAKTGAGLIGHSFIGSSAENAAVQNGLTYFNNSWSVYRDSNGWYEHLYGNIYAMYGLTKACRELRYSDGSHITEIGTHDWYEEYVEHLLNSSYGQHAAGNWTASQSYFQPVLTTSFAIMILNPEAIITQRPVAIATASPQSACPGTPVNFDGSNSYHQNIDQIITTWMWDFDSEDGVDWEDPDAVGAMVTKEDGYLLPPGEISRTYHATLRVLDNSDPPKESVTTVAVIATIENNPPIACLHCPCTDEPYTGKIGEEIFFDGSCSYDPDFLCTGDEVAAWSWDLNGDGIFGDAVTPTTSYTWHTEYNGQVGLKVWDTHDLPSTGSVYITIWTSHVDLSISADDVAFSQDAGMTTVSITAGVRCETDDPARTIESVKVRFFDGDPAVSGVLIGEVTLNDFSNGVMRNAELDWSPPDEDTHEIYVSVDPDKAVEEWDETNNMAMKRWPSDCEQPILSLTGYTTVVWNDPIWEVRVRVHNEGPGSAHNVTITMNEDIPWLTVPDPTCFYGEIGDGEDSWGENDSYTFDLTNSPGGNFNIWFDVEYQDGCGKVYHLRLDPEFDPENVEEDIPELVTIYRLAQNYPNPFNPNTMISYQIPVSGHVSLKIYDITGKLVRTLVNEHKDKGLFGAEWDGRNEQGTRVSSGVYLYRIQSGTFVDTKKMILMR